MATCNGLPPSLSNITLNRTGLEAGAEKIVAAAAAAAKLVRSDDATSEAAPANRLRTATNR